MGLSGWAQADDTDIYLSGTGGGQEVIRPNVLLVLDTSDSMNAAVPGTGLSRLENMRIALADLLNNLDNVNVGFMRFTGHRSPNNPNPYVGTGGPVIFPVANLDAAASTITRRAVQQHHHHSGASRRKRRRRGRATRYHGCSTTRLWVSASEPRPNSRSLLARVPMTASRRLPATCPAGPAGRLSGQPGGALAYRLHRAALPERGHSH